jgi:predicted DCC family thiol-disulfide oxidoreductase YuxK
VTDLAKPLLVYDGDCGFCRAWIERWRRATGDALDYAPYQEVAERFPGVEREAFAAAVHLIEPDGGVSRGAEAVFRALAFRPGGGAWWWAYRRLPGFAAASEWLYAQVAAHRPALTRLTRWIPGGPRP